MRLDSRDGGRHLKSPPTFSQMLHSLGFEIRTTQVRVLSIQGAPCTNGFTNDDMSWMYSGLPQMGGPMTRKYTMMK